MAALIWNQSSTNRWAARAAEGLFSQSYNGHEEVAAFQDVVFRQSWMVTIATVMNVSPSLLPLARSKYSLRTYLYM